MPKLSSAKSSYGLPSSSKKFCAFFLLSLKFTPNILSFFSSFNSSKTEIWYPLFSLKDSDRLKIIESKKEEAEYWITNYWFDDNIYDKNFFDKYEIVNEVLVDGNKINSLFKRKN